MKFRLAFCLLTMFVVASCVQVKPLTVKSVTCCDLKKALKTETEVAFEIEMENPNSFPITIKCYDLAVRLNGNNIGNAKSDDAAVIPSGGSVKKSISVTTSTQKLISGTLLMGA